MEGKQQASDEGDKVNGLNRGSLQKHSVVNSCKIRHDLGTEYNGIVNEIDHEHGADSDKQGTAVVAVEKVDTAGCQRQHHGEQDIIDNRKQSRCQKIPLLFMESAE